jgi:hypothetical protein
MTLHVRVVAAIAAVVLFPPLFVPAGAATARQDPGGPTTVVFPTGQYPTDVDNVQGAVDLGGTVVLKAINTQGDPTPFNFGVVQPVAAVPWWELPGGAVFFTTDVTVVGETVSGRMTTVLGGNAPFRSYAPVRSAVHDVFFDGPRVAAVDLARSTGFAMTGSHVARTVPFLVFPEGDLWKSQGIWVAPVAIDSFSGEILLERNVFEDAGVGAELGYGLFIAPLFAKVTVANNTIRGATLAGVFVALHGNEVVIEGNRIEPGSADPVDPNWANGVHTLGTFFGGSVIVRDNDISVAGPVAHGVFSFGDDTFNGPVRESVIEGNRITTTAGWAGIGLYSLASSNRVRGNRLVGTADHGLVLGDINLIFGEEVFPPVDAAGNAFVANQVARLHTEIADVYFDHNTVDNALAGYSGNVVDLGTGNQVTGTTASPPRQIGERIRSDRASHGLRAPAAWLRGAAGHRQD